MVQTFFIILATEPFAQYPRFGSADKESFGQQLIAEAAVETLPKAVLSGTARRNEVALALPSGKPGL